ncbi:MAG: two-component system sensor histidine kinase NtrB [Gammaproteobacteria bacterium]
MIKFLCRHPFGFPALLAALIGVFFPFSSLALLLWHDQLRVTWQNIAALHENNYALYVSWTVPAALAFFGAFIGKTARLLQLKMVNLEHQTTRLNTILDTAASAIVTIDDKGVIVSFNKAAEHIFGFKQSEIIGQKVNRLMASDTAKDHDKHLKHYVETEQASVVGRRREVEAKRKNGKLFPAKLQVNPMRIGGKLFFASVIDDISETKTLQEQLVIAQKMEAIGQLASGVAHEINTPMQYIGDNLATLNEYVFALDAYQNAMTAIIPRRLLLEVEKLKEQYDVSFIMEDGPKAIQQSLEGVERVSEIVKALKNFSHIEANQQTQCVELHELIRNVLTISRNSYKQLAEILTDFADNIPTIEGYPAQLNQAFLNLIINAVHAIEEKQSGIGLIRIQTRRLDDRVEVLIKDNGIGIPESIQNKVFNLFFTTKPVGKGTGQGLSLTHEIVVEKHHGQLFFESESGVGTTFHVNLPITLGRSVN